MSLEVMLYGQLNNLLIELMTICCFYQKLEQKQIVMKNRLIIHPINQVEKEVLGGVK